jgi:hypothetical protein
MAWGLSKKATLCFYAANAVGVLVPFAGHASMIATPVVRPFSMLVSVLSLASALCSQSPGSTNTCYSVGTQPHSVATGNFDGANGNDVVVSNEAANTVQLLLNNGSGVLQAQAAITVGTAPRGLTAADFDGDGNLDVAVACAGSAAVYMPWR